MRDFSSRDSSGWPQRGLQSAPNRGAGVGLTVSLLGHSSVLALVISVASTHLAPFSLVPIDIVTTEDVEAHESQLSFSDHGIPARTHSSKSAETSETDDDQTLVVAKLDDALPGGEADLSSTQATPHRDPSDVRAIQPEIAANQNRSEVRAKSYHPGTPAILAQGTATFREDNSAAASAAAKITRRTDWQANPVEDNTLTYALLGSATRVTVREVSSGGFLGAGFAGGFGASDATSASEAAKSQKIDWTFVNRQKFGVTAYAYQNEIGYGFHPFDQAKKEFATPGTTTMKAGGEVRLGAFALGASHSSITSLDDASLAFSPKNEKAEAALDEASLSVDLVKFLPGNAGFVAKLVPIVWIAASERNSASFDQASTVGTSFGGSWKWNYGHATIGYWDYSSQGEAPSDTGWSGHGFDANLGAYYGAFGLDLSASYGRSEDVAPSWQSSGALYNSTAAMSYTPDKLPGFWVSGTIGNYDRNELTSGMASSEIYGVAASGEYWSMAAGLELTNLLWSPVASSGTELRSVKLLYRYTDTLSADNATGATSETNSLGALMVQRKF